MALPNHLPRPSTSSSSSSSSTTSSPLSLSLPFAGKKMASKRRWRALQLLCLLGVGVYLLLRPSIRSLLVPLPSAPAPLSQPLTDAGSSSSGGGGGAVPLADMPIPRPIESSELAPPDPPLTSLGEEADSSFHLLTPTSYTSDLTSFILQAFPSSLHSPLLAALSSQPSATDLPPPIPKKIWQTHRSQDSAPLDTTRTWWETNPESSGWNRTFLSDSSADSFVRSYLGEAWESELAWVWHTLPRGVLRSDMLRYLVLLLEGGVYSDTDTICLKPISRWGRGAEVWTIDSSPQAEEAVQRAWEQEDQEVARDDPPRGVIVGIEADVGTRADWHAWWPRPLQIVQWTLVLPPYHPIALDALRRIHAATAFAASWVVLQNASHPEGKPGAHGRGWEVKDAREEMGGPMSVMEWTGPGVWTDAVLSYLTRITLPAECAGKAGGGGGGGWFGGLGGGGGGVGGGGRGCEPSFSWPLLRGLERPLRVGDVTVLPVTGFAPGTGMFNAKSIAHEQAMVEHKFAGSWKTGIY